MPISVMVLIGMVLGTLGLAGYRKLVSRSEDDFIHLGSEDTGIVSAQVHTAETLDRIDRAGKALTTVTGIYAVAVLAWFVWQEMTRRGAL